MKPTTRTDEELLVWAAELIRHHQERGTHGEVRIQLKAGRIQSLKVESSHLPPPRDQ